MPRFWGNVGAGILPLSKKTCRVLIQHRSNHVNEPGTWGIIGGAVSKVSTLYGIGEVFEEIGVPEEKIREGMMDEFREETDFRGKVTPVSKFNVFEAFDWDGEKVFEYHSYVGTIDDEFTPPTNKDDPYKFWEAEDYKWVDVKALLDSAGDEEKFERIIGKRGSRLHPKFKESLLEGNVRRKLMEARENCLVKKSD